VLAGDDRLDVDPAYLRVGDTFIQLFRLSVPSEAASGALLLQVGVYDPETGARVQTESGDDRLVLTTLTWAGP